MENKFFITTPLYYVNADPHIGHSYTNIAADTLSRFYRSRKREVYFLTGSDEHGQKIAKSAAAENLEPLDFCNKMVVRFKSVWEKLNVRFDDFIRTTEPRHENTVKWVLSFLYKNGDIYLDQYSGWYCLPCESFWTKDQLIDDKCPDCKREVEYISEKNYFFRLSKYQDWLIEYIKANTDFIMPQSRRNEVLSFLEKNRLQDLCITRPKERLKWGITTPFSEDYVTYVWFDALINYISAVGFSYDEKKFKRWWPADVHLIGKDILRQHAIYWPIMLRALKIDMPKVIFAHGWWLSSAKVDGQKISKSKGNIINPLDIIQRYGVDVYRYFLLREVPFGLDGVFDESALRKRYNSDLANDLGNLVHRTFTMIEKYFSGNIPIVSDISKISDNPLMKQTAELFSKLDVAMQRLDFSSALSEIWLVINKANKYIEDTKPWLLLKEGKSEQLKEFILVLIEVIKKVSEEISCFMPQTAERILACIHSDKIESKGPLFPRLVL